MRSALEKLRLDVEEKRKNFMSEKASWEEANGMTFEDLKRRNLETLAKE